MPSKRKELINPVRVFFAIVIVVIIWFAPIAFPLRAEKLTATKEASPLTYVFASSADACPYSCIICTSWETGKWPKGCLTWRCDVDCENSGGGGGNQPPTISHVLNCAQPGSNGWCMGNLSLDLTASDPQGSQVIISGDVNGVAFACQSGATTCTIPLSEGAGNANYRVDAAATGLSASGNITYLLDSSTPQLNGSASGVVGTNGWYRSNVTLSVESSDAVSGIASVIVNVDGINSNYQSPITFSDGVHTVNLSATDNAGHVTQTTQTFNIDTVTPVLNVSLSGSAGANNWYISNVTITPSANDSGSGLASLEATMDGGPWTVVNSPLLFTDGIHSYQFRATDNAGNITETATQEIKVDATTPAISLKVNGTRGQNDWYVSDASVTPTAADATSGIATLEVSQDNSPFTNSQSPITFSDGLHSYQFRITDNAGNTTQIPMQQIKIDTVFPVIAMADELKLGETLYYDLEDPTTRSAQVSGLWINRQVIEDDAEKYKKVVWQEVISGNKAEGDILWDGVFADGVKVDAGEYFITLKISDAAGNETMRTAIVKVNVLSFLQIIPPFTPPQTTTLPVQTTQTDSAAVTEFGGTNSGATGAESASITAGGTAVFNSETDYVQAGFTQGNETTSTPITNSGILWGAAATAMLGATLADWQRKREEKEARKRAEAAAHEEEEVGSGRKTPGQRAYEAMMKQKHIVGESQALLNEKARERAEQAEAARQNLIAKNEGRAPVNMAKVNQLVEAEAAREKLIAKNEDHASVNMEKVNALVEAQAKQEVEKKSWWQKGAEFAERILPQPVKQVFNTKAIVGAVLSLALSGIPLLGFNNIANDPHAFDAAQQNAQTEFALLDQKYPEFREEKKSLLYLFTNPYEVFSSGYDITKAIANSAAGYVDAAWQHNPVNKIISNELKQIGDSCPESLGEAWGRRCSAVPYFLAGVIDHPVDTTIGVLTSLVADPVAGYIKLTAYHYENNNPYQLIADIYQSTQKDGLIEGVGNVIVDRIDGAWNLVTTDPQVQSFGFLAILAAIAFIPLVGEPLALTIGGGIVLSQTANLLTQVDAALQSVPTRKEAMQAVTNPQIRRQLATTIVLLGLLIYGGKKELDTYSKVTAFQETLSSSAQTSFSELPYSKQVELFKVAKTLNASTQVLEFYLTESARPNSVLAGLSLTDALRVSPILQDYIARYGYNKALRMATPEVIRGLENSQFLVQAQDIISRDAGYNLTPEYVFTTYPESTIGVRSTFITNEASLVNIIGDFHGTKTIYITYEQAIALETSLGLESGTLAKGFRISKISNLNSLNLSYPLKGTEPLFLGPGKGLPGGGTEITINPPVPMNSPHVVDQIIINVVYP